MHIFFLGLFSGRLIFRGACNWMEFCVLKWVGLDNNNSLHNAKHKDNSLKQLTLQSTGLYSGGLIIGGIFASEIQGAYFRQGLFLEGLIMRILRYFLWEWVISPLLAPPVLHPLRTCPSWPGSGH